MDKKPCTIEHICPWGAPPTVGMWTRLDGDQLYGTDCKLYTDCPRAGWLPMHWEQNPTRIRR